MQLSSTLISRFQQAHLEAFGEAISSEAAERDLLDLAELLRIAHRLQSSEDTDE